MHLTRQPWSDLPEALQAVAQQAWQSYLQAAEEQGCDMPDSVELQSSLCRVFALSEYAAGVCRLKPELVMDLLATGDLLADYHPEIFYQSIHQQVVKTVNEFELKACLRFIRQREMLRIIWRDLMRWAQLEGTLADLSMLAEACVATALDKLSAWQAQQTPVPIIDGSRKQAELVVLAMGKMGADELNLSSDIDLIFTYPDCHETRKRGAKSPEEYFTQLGRALIRALNDRDSNGFVFRVDMRLRPYGDSGALVCSFAAMEEYYQNQGVEWERYAMIKARPVTGSEVLRQQLMQMLRPFVYRRYLDFGTFDALRDLKRQIQAQVEHKGQQNNLKLGPGGIREIEFIAQVFQLVRGGREHALRERRVQVILPLLASQNQLSEQCVDELLAAYRFLRHAENAVQAMRDEQTHMLPENALDQQRLSCAMGFVGWDAFIDVLQAHRDRVQQHFDNVFADVEEQANESPANKLWTNGLSDDEQLALIIELGFDDVEEAHRWIRHLRRGAAQTYLGEQGRVAWNQLLPLLINTAASYPQNTRVLARLFKIIEKVAGRSTYLLLLLENPSALEQLVKLCDASEWIADYLSRYPILLDQLLDPVSLYAPLEQAQLSQELSASLSGVAQDDLEMQMDLMRQFRHAMVLRVASADIASVIEVAVVSDYLTAIAEVILEKTWQLAWLHTIARYGEPRCGSGRKLRLVNFGIVAYGKLGGIELGYGSDLDIVFLHDSDGEVQQTKGHKSVDNSVFFNRLGQRIVHMLATPTAAGSLYEVDTRLRPSGHSGMLVSSLQSFVEYQRHHAWTWEHQALVRARMVSGADSLKQGFEQVRNEILSQPRDFDVLRIDVREMRLQMRAELDAAETDKFHLKQGAGGIVDIEFMVQYQVLRWVETWPQLLQYTDTVRLLETLAQVGVFSADDAQSLIEAYRCFRGRVHHLTLRGEPVILDADCESGKRQAVLKMWQAVFEPC